MNHNYLTPTALSKYLKFMFDNNEHLQSIYIKGEISNFKAHPRGHFYFTLKDETSRINAVMFKSAVSTIKYTPQDGMKVLIKGRVTVYELGGSYQLYVEEMLEDGVGNLYIAYEQLKKKLESEGLFEQSHKKQIPKIPQVVGIVTASTGAAIKDVLTTIKRRYPICKTILFPSLVQGINAAEDIVKNIKLANARDDLDVLIIGRGGGSIEDLWPFNEEIVARAIYDSKIPTISAVGHEVDFTIADFVADMRAPTPTAAGELAVPDIKTLVTYLDNVQSRTLLSINNYIESKTIILNKLKNSYVLKKPMAIYEIMEQKLDNLIDVLNKDISNVLYKYQVKILNLRKSYILTNPQILYQKSDQKLDKLIEKLNVLNPLNTIKRGFAIIKNEEDEILSSCDKIQNNQIINIVLKDGQVKGKIMKEEE